MWLFSDSPFFSIVVAVAWSVTILGFCRCGCCSLLGHTQLRCPLILTLLIYHPFHCWFLATLGGLVISIYGCIGRLILFIVFISILTALAICGLLRRWCSSLFVVALAFRRSATFWTHLCKYTFYDLLLWPLATQHNFELLFASIILSFIYIAVAFRCSANIWTPLHEYYFIIFNCCSGLPPLVTTSDSP